MKLLKNAILELEITDMDCEGMGISHYEEYTIFVKDALIGETCKALILKATTKIAFAKTIAILKRSNHRAIPSCPYFGKCGGCNLMHMDYEMELSFKEHALKNTINKMVKDFEFGHIVKADEILHYRNKISLPVGYDDEGFIVGFYQERSHNIIPSNICYIENSAARGIINELIGYLNESNIYPYDEMTHTGDVRHLVLRVNSKNEFMLIMVVREIKDKIIKLLKRFYNPLVKSIYINENKERTNVIMGSSFIHISGDEYLHEELFGNTFLIHPNSFFQVNYKQMQKLYQTAIKLLEPKETDVVIDAYSGIGTISLTLAKYVKKVYGIEVVKEAVLNAKQNKAKNNIKNVEFILGKCEDEIASLVNKEHIDAIVMDPPRKGSDKLFLDTIIKAGIAKVIYISCGPAALARDLKYMKDNGYEIEKIIPVDMFPKTSNIESVVSLTKKIEK